MAPKTEKVRKNKKIKNKVHKKKKNKQFFNSENETIKHNIKLANKNKENINYFNHGDSAIKRKKQKHKQIQTKILTTMIAVPKPKIKISEEEKAEINSRTIFVGNLPISLTRKKLKKLFSKYGPVESARLRCSALNMSHLPRSIAIDKQDFHPKATSVNGFVKFVSKDTVKEALKANGTVYKEHHLRVDVVDANKTENIQNSVFLGNLPFDVANNAVRKHFEDCGEIESINVVRDGSTGLGKGFGYVNFKSPSSIELALKLNGSPLNKRNIRVKRAVKKFAEKRLTEKRISDQIELDYAVGDNKLKSDEKIFSFQPKRSKKEKKKKDNPELAFQGKTANKIKKRKSKKKLKKELIKKQLVEVLNKIEMKKK